MEPLSPFYYTDSSTIDLEYKNIFQKQWQLIGLSNELPNHNDYICREVGNLSIIVQNTKGDLAAFRNVCPHRFSQLKDKETGSSPLVCPYHGWSFNGSGELSGVPLEQTFSCKMI